MVKLYSEVLKYFIHTRVTRDEQLWCKEQAKLAGYKKTSDWVRFKLGLQVVDRNK